MHGSAHVHHHAMASTHPLPCPGNPPELPPPPRVPTVEPDEYEGVPPLLPPQFPDNCPVRRRRAAQLLSPDMRPGMKSLPLADLPSCG